MTSRPLVSLVLLCCLVIGSCAGSRDLNEAREEAAWLQEDAEAAVAYAEEDAAEAWVGVRQSLTPWGTQAEVNQLIGHLSAAAGEDFTQPMPLDETFILIADPFYWPPRLLDLTAPQHRQDGTFRKIGHFLVILRDGRLFVVDTRATPRLVNRHDIPPPEPLADDEEPLVPTPDGYHVLLATGNIVVAAGQSSVPDTTILSTFRLDPMTGRLELLSDLLVTGVVADDIRIVGDRLILSARFGVRSLSGAEPMPTIGWLRRVAGPGGTVRHEPAGAALPLVTPERLYGPFTPVRHPTVTAVINCPLTRDGPGSNAACETKGFVSDSRPVLKVENDATYLVLRGDPERSVADFVARTYRGILDLGAAGHRLIDTLELDGFTPANKRAFCATPAARTARASQMAAVVRLPHDPARAEQAAGLSLLHGMPDSAADLSVQNGRLYVRTVLEGFSCLESVRLRRDVRAAGTALTSRPSAHDGDGLAEQTLLESLPLSALQQTAPGPSARTAASIPDYRAFFARVIMHEGWLVYSLDTTIQELRRYATDEEWIARTGRYWIAAVPLDRPTAAAIIAAPMNVAWFHPLPGQLLMGGQTLDASALPNSRGWKDWDQPDGSLVLSLLRLGNAAEVIRSQSVPGLGLQPGFGQVTGIGYGPDGRLLVAIPTHGRPVPDEAEPEAEPDAAPDQTAADGITLLAIRPNGRITHLHTIPSSWVSPREGAGLQASSDPFPNGYTCQVCEDWDWLRIGMIADGTLYALIGGHLSILTPVGDGVRPVTRIDLTDPATTPRPL